MSTDKINSNNYLLSILIPSLTERIDKFSILIKKINKQIEDNNLKNKVQIISHIDNRSVPLMDKRNKMMKRARGKYLVHLDDDDDISSDYIKEVCNCISNLKDSVDIISYNQKAIIGKNKIIFVKSDLKSDFSLTPLGNNWYVRYPWQWCAWRTSLVRNIFRNDSDQGPKFEDVNWLKRVMLSYPTTQKNIDKVLHIFNGYRDMSDPNTSPSACGW